MITFRWIRRAAGLLAACALQAVCHAQNYPDRPVTLVVPYGPGGAVDQIGRAMAKFLEGKWKQPVIVMNKPGASAIVGSIYVSRSKPDGYTLEISDSSTFVTVPHMLDQLPFNVQKDFAPITIAARQPAILTTRPGFPAATTRQLIDYAKAHPGQVTYGSFGTGTWTHVAMEEMSKDAGIRMLHIPHTGGAQVLVEMMAGRVDIYFATMGAISEYVKAGKLKILATATAKRLADYPDLPTVSESGVPGFSLSLWFGLVAPAGTPASILDKIQQDVADLNNNDPQFQRQVLKALFLQPGGETRPEFAKILVAENDHWKSVIEQAGLKPQASK